MPEPTLHAHALRAGCAGGSSEQPKTSRVGIRLPSGFSRLRSSDRCFQRCRKPNCRLPSKRGNNVANNAKQRRNGSLAAGGNGRFVQVGDTAPDDQQSMEQASHSGLNLPADNSLSGAHRDTKDDCQCFDRRLEMGIGGWYTLRRAIALLIRDSR